MKTETIIKAGVAIGVVAGAWMAFRPSCSDNGRNLQEQRKNLKPLSLLVANQINTETLTAEILQKWFVDTVYDRTAGKEMIVALLKDEFLEALGYYIDVAIDRNHYALCKILNQAENDDTGAVLINFGKIAQNLQELLDSGNGMIKVTGDM